jgi:hypothetical protein
MHSKAAGFGCPRALLSSDRDNLVNVTPPTSGAGNEHLANAQPANSSMADLLFADSPGKSGQDFRAIAAALFGADSSTSSPAQLPDKKLTPAKATSRLPQEEPDTRKSNESPDPSSAPAYPGLTVPPLDIPKPSLDVAPLLAGTAKVVSQTNSDKDLDLPAPATSKLPSETSETIASLSSPDQPIVEGQALVEGNIGNGVKSAREAPLQTSSTPATGIPSKKPAPDAFRVSGFMESARPAVTQTLPSAARLAASPAQQPPTAIDATASAAAVAQTSVATAPEILDSSMAAKVALQSSSIQSGLTADSKSVPGTTTPGAATKIKDRDTKDTKTDSARSTKFASADAGNPESGLTRTIATNSKDNAGAALTTHSDAHAEASPLKQAAGAAFPQTAIAETDGPDEALPTSSPSPVTAKMVQGMTQSEFRVGMLTQEFGNIDIRTSLAQHMFSAQISVEHGDMAKSMSADLPALYHKLADQQVTVASIVIQGQNLATSSGLAHDAQPQPWHKPQAQQGTSPETKTIAPLTAEVIESAGRLDIRI